MMVPIKGAMMKKIKSYPPVGSGATKGVISEGYMLVRIRSCLKPRYVPNLPFKKHGGKNGGNFRAFYTASDDRISLPEA